MTDDKSTNVLLSSLEAIKKDSEEDALKPAAPAKKAEAAAPRPSPTGLLDSLLDEVKKEADREIQEITRNLEQKTAEVKKQQEEDERRKKEQYDRLIQEEAQRRLSLIEKKEEERRRLEREAAAREERKRMAELDAIRKKNQKRHLMIGAASTAGLAVITAVLVLTGVIPLGTTNSEDSKPLDAIPSYARPDQPKDERKGPEGPPIEEPEFLPPGGVVDGPAVEVLAISEHNDLRSFRQGGPTGPKALALNVRSDVMQQKLAKAFAASHGGGHSSDGSSSGGITIDTSVFRD